MTVRFLFTSVVFTVIAAWPIAGKTSQASLRMIIHVGDCVGVPGDLLAATKERIEKVFSKMDVQADWNYSDKSTRCVLDPLLSSSTFNQFQIVIVSDITSGPRANDKTVTGVALRDRPLAFVYYDRVVRIIDTARKNMKLQPSDSSIAAQVLSATIAHELGHLLLPPRVNHSRTGIMAAWWTVTELTERYRTHVAELTFTPQETELIRQKLRPEC